MEWSTLRSASVYLQIINVSWITDLFASLNCWIEKLKSLTSDTNSANVKSIWGTKAFLLSIWPNSSIYADRSTYFGSAIIGGSWRAWPAGAIIHSVRTNCATARSIVILLINCIVAINWVRERNTGKQQSNCQDSCYWIFHIGYNYESKNIISGIYII